MVDFKKSSSKAARVRCATPDCTFRVTTNRLKNGRWHIPCSTFVWEHSASCIPTSTQLPLRPSFLASLPVFQSALIAQPETSAKTLQKSLLSSGNNVQYQQVVRAKRIALRDTLLAANEDLAMIGALCSAFASLNPNSVIDVDYAEADGEKVLRRFFLYPGSHVKVAACLLSCWSADACHLKALLFKHQIFGILSLTATGRLFILALAFADTENTENWEWFFRNLLRAGGVAPLLNDGKVSGKCVFKLC